MYRAVTLVALEKGINLEDESSYSFVKDLDIKYEKKKYL